jgi:hypothetical protein
MLQLINTSAVALSAGDAMPANVDYNTNPNMLGYDAGTNEIVFLQPGIYKVFAQAVFAATAAGLNTVQGYSGATAIPGMVSQFESTAETQEATYVVQKNVRVNTAVPGAFARLKFEVDADGVQSNLIITVEKIR